MLLENNNAFKQTCDADITPRIHFHSSLKCASLLNKQQETLNKKNDLKQTDFLMTAPLTDRSTMRPLCLSLHSFHSL